LLAKTMVRCAGERRTGRADRPGELALQPVDFALLPLDGLFCDLRVAAGADELGFLRFDGQPVTRALFDELGLVGAQLVYFELVPSVLVAEVFNCFAQAFFFSPEFF
jgi:hypothetical protein